VLTETTLGRLRNFRDIGGHRTRSGREVGRGMIYRCGCMHQWTEDDVSAIRTAVGPRTLIDLRRGEEAQQFPVPAELLRARYLNLPFPTKSSWVRPKTMPSLAESYVAIARRSGPSIIRLLETVADRSNLPAIVFCAAGKDRTGVAAAILLGALNVDEDRIAADYALTGTVDPHTLEDGYAEQFANLPLEYQGSEPQTMRSMLATIRAEEGSVRTFVAKLGFGAEGLVALERALLRPEFSAQPTRPVT
jgi:protein-tyrosine phosphatase